MLCTILYIQWHLVALHVIYLFPFQKCIPQPTAFFSLSPVGRKNHYRHCSILQFLSPFPPPRMNYVFVLCHATEENHYMDCSYFVVNAIRCSSLCYFIKSLVCFPPLINYVVVLTISMFCAVESS